MPLKRPRQSHDEMSVLTTGFTKTQHSRWLRSPVVTLLLPVGSGSEKPLGVGRALLSFNEERWRRRGWRLGLRGKLDPRADRRY
jgi:hypothetical protein